MTRGLRDPAPFQVLWESLVRDYTSKKITKDSDRLIALAGVVKQVGDALNLQNYTGLWLPDNSKVAREYYNDNRLPSPWKTNFVQSLSWRTAYCTMDRRPERAQAPSWSSASVEHDDGIVCALEVTNHIVLVLSINDEEGPTCATRQCLQLWGATLTATLRRIGPDGPALSFLVECNGAGIQVYPDVAGEAEHDKRVLCLLLADAWDRVLMLFLTEGEGGANPRYRRLRTTGVESEGS